MFPKITKEIFIYGFGGSLSQIVAMITIPIISRILSTTEYGSVDIITASTGYFSALITLNLTAGLMRFYFEIPENSPNERRQLVSTLVWFILLFGGFIVFGGILFSGNISRRLFGASDYVVSINLALASLPFIALNGLFGQIYRIQRKPLFYLSFNLLFAILSFLLTLVFVLLFHFRIEGVFIAQLISAVIMSGINAWKCKAFLQFAFSKTWLFTLSKYGIPMMPGSMLNWGLLTINRLILTQFTSISQIAYYTVANKTAKILEFLVQSFILAWQPIFLASINDETFHKKLDQALWYYSTSMILLSAIVTTYAKEIFLILAPPEYLLGAPLVALLCLKQAIIGSTYIFSVGVIKEKKTFLISVSLAVGFVTTVGVSFLLTPRYNIIGAAISDLAGILANCVIYFIFSQKLLKIDLDIRRIVLLIFGFFGLYFSTIWNTNLPGFGDFVFRSVILLVFSFFVLVFLDKGILLKAISLKLSKLTNYAN